MLKYRYFTKTSSGFILENGLYTIFPSLTKCDCLIDFNEKDARISTRSWIDYQTRYHSQADFNRCIICKNCGSYVLQYKFPKLPTR